MLSEVEPTVMDGEWLATQDSAQRLDERALSKLRWRCRRGLLENDLFIERFFARFADSLTYGQARGLNRLMELADNDLLDLLLKRREPGADMTTNEVREVLVMLTA